MRIKTGTDNRFQPEVWYQAGKLQGLMPADFNQFTAGCCILPVVIVTCFCSLAFLLMQVLIDACINLSLSIIM